MTKLLVTDTQLLFFVNCDRLRCDTTWHHNLEDPKQHLHHHPQISGVLF